MGQAPPHLNPPVSYDVLGGINCEFVKITYYYDDSFIKTILLVFTYFIIKKFYIINYRGNLH